MRWLRSCVLLLCLIGAASAHALTPADALALAQGDGDTRIATLNRLAAEPDERAFALMQALAGDGRWRAAPQRRAATAAHVLRGLRVLLVEDNAVNRGFLAATLAHWGVRLETVADAAQAQARLAQAAAAGGLALGDEQAGLQIAAAPAPGGCTVALLRPREQPVVGRIDAGQDLDRQPRQQRLQCRPVPLHVPALRPVRARRLAGCRRVRVGHRARLQRQRRFFGASSVPRQLALPQWHG